ncbi:hypothetical protein [Streptomyces roseolus]|uniref:hypothetical protein n=1 Tax=Streptomyces roseolus TaxID=67358 RepID=UPI001675BF7E|nr:hypothetical protein [Streptomyces roseolus]
MIAAMESIADKSGIRIATVEERQQKQRRIVLALGISFAMTFVMLIAVLLIGVGMRQQARDIERIQDRVTGEVLCPLYQQFINADTPKAREAAKRTGQDMEVRDRAFTVIRQGYKTLDCENVSVIRK